MEYCSLSPPGVSVHITRTSMPEEGSVTLESMTGVAGGERFGQLAADLVTVRSNAIARMCTSGRHLAVIHPDAIAYACTSGSFIYGAGKDMEIIRCMEEAGGVPCAMTSMALVKAADALGINNLSVAVPYPYPDEVSERLRVFLEGSGFEVASLTSLDLTCEIYMQPTGATCRLAKEADTPEAKAVLISCTNLRTVEILDTLEQDLRKLVVSANQATVWETLQLAGINSRRDGLGMLYRLE